MEAVKILPMILVMIAVSIFVLSGFACDTDDRGDDDDGGPQPEGPLDTVAVGGMFDPTLEEQGLVIERIAGGATGHDGTAVAVGPNDEVYVAAAAQHGLYLHTIDGPVNFFELLPIPVSFPSLAVDADGALHLAYRDTRTRTLSYATNRSGTWKTKVIRDSEIGENLELALDADGYAHIAFNDALYQTLSYTTGRTGWTIKRVSTEAGSGHFPTLDVQPDGTPHLEYFSNTSVIHATWESGQWVKTVVDKGSTLPNRLSILVDDQGIAHIGYHYYQDVTFYWPWSVDDDKSDPQSKWYPTPIEVTFAFYKYATNASGAWNTSVMDWGAKEGLGCSLALDPKGRVRMLYAMRNWDGAYKLKIAIKTGGIWQKQFLADARVTHPSLAVDSDGRSHVAYHRISSGTMIYATSRRGFWEYERLGFAGDIGRFHDLAVDAEGVAHVSYAGHSGEGLLYATKAGGGAWTSDVLITHADIRCPTAVALDGDGVVQIVYDDYRQLAGVMHATDRDGPWDFSHITNAKLENLSMVVDPEGRLHVAMQPLGRDMFRYATDAGGSWVQRTVSDPGTYYSKYPAIAQDSSGDLHVAFAGFLYDGNLDLKMASGGLGQWAIDDIDTPGNVGMYPSIAVDSQDGIHISYHNAGLGALKYAWRKDGDVGNEQVDYAGEYSSIAVDATGHAHISYYNAEQQGLRYATNASGDWITCEIDRGGDVGQYSHIALDDEGRVHVTYYGEGALWYAHFPQSVCPTDDVAEPVL